MIWVEATDTIYVLYNDGRQAVQFEDMFDGSVDPISDSSIAAPVGLRQPTYGFGKVWREQPGVRDKLGWALESELNTVGYIQEYSGNNDSGSYVSGADGFVWKISNVSAGLQWQKTTINNPN